MTRWFLDQPAENGTPAPKLRRPASAPVGRTGSVRPALFPRAHAGDVAEPTCRLMAESAVDHEVEVDVRAIHADRTLPIVAVTGTADREAVAAFLRAIRRAEGQIVGSVGAGTWFDGEAIRPTGPDALDRNQVAAMVDAMGRQRCHSAVLEVDDPAIDRRELDDCPLAAVVVHGLGESGPLATADRHDRRRLIARLIRRVDAGGVVVIDADDAEADVLGAVNLAARRVTFGIVAPDAPPRADITAQIDRLDAHSCRFLLGGFDRAADVTLRLGGGHATVRAALAAAALAWAEGVELDAVVRGLESVARIPGRFEPVRVGQRFEVRVDRARTPEALAQSLSDLRSITAGRVICVVGAPGSESNDEPTAYRIVEQARRRAALGRAAEAHADLVVVTADNPRDENPNALGDEVRAGMIRPGRARVEPDRGTAIALAFRVAEPRDGVLIAGKGTRAYQVVGPQTLSFDDAAVAAQILRDQATAPRISA